MIHTDLVTYENPFVIDTLDDLWNADPSTKISFVEAESSLSHFSRYSIGDRQRDILERAKKQWENIENDHFLIPADQILVCHQIIKENNMAVFMLYETTEMIIGAECCQTQIPYSKLYVSVNPVSQLTYYRVTSPFIGQRMRERLEDLYQRALRSGLEAWALRTYPDKILGMLLPSKPSLGCTSTNLIQMIGSKPLTSVGIIYCTRLFMIMIGLNCVSSILNLVEKLNFKFSSWYWNRPRALRQKMTVKEFQIIRKSGIKPSNE